MSLLLLLALAADPAQLFTATIQPTLTRECAGCHGAGQALSKLDVRSREALLQGGARGPAIVPGDASASRLFQYLTHGGAQQMPPGKRLPDATIAAFRIWLDAGAPWPSAGPQLWSLRPLLETPLQFPPATKRAAPRTLLRRLRSHL